jgi:sialic acid synthase SpsE
MKNKIFIIAEIGNNHEGNYKNAKKLIYNAYLSGVNAVKFQIFNTEKFISKNNSESYSKFKKFELSQKLFLKLKKYAESLNLIFFGSAFDRESLNFLIKNTKIIKVASSENNNFEFICKILKNKKKCILSTGFLKFNQIKQLIKKLNKKFSKNFIKNNLTLLHCVSAYPTMGNDLNLSVIKKLKSTFKLKIGYSDHSLGIKACEIAFLQGAEVIEKHFTLDKNFSKFRDHHLSADLNEMKNLIKNLTDAQRMLGNEIKNITHEEKKNLTLCRRSFYLKKKVKKKKIIKLHDLILLRPLVPNSAHLDNIKKFIGKKYKKNYNKNEVLK